MDAARLLTPHEERRVAVVACVDPRTVRALLAGRIVTSTCRARIELALRELGLTPEHHHAPTPEL